VPQDYAEAACWYRKAADQADADAQRNLAYVYYIGQGVPQDYAEAARWYRKAADQGSLMRSTAWASCSRRAKGYRRTMFRRTCGSTWPVPAATSTALRAEDIVAGKMTPNEIVEAQRRAREWGPETSR